ncbi:MAG: hypothetical protein GY717_19550, partial [Rhodobacteraceae bacterium]|nr:hypothetical protein [Paracoccaceae bacterium]
MFKPFQDRFRTFRAKLHALFPRRADATMDLLDSLAGNRQADSPVKLSLNAPFRRRYGSIHDAVDNFAVAEPGAPGGGGEPAKGGVPVGGDVPAKGSEPAKGDAPVGGDVPAKSKEPVKGDAPVGGDVPVKGREPAKGDAPVGGDVPAKGNEPAK